MRSYDCLARSSAAAATGYSQCVTCAATAAAARPSPKHSQRQRPPLPSLPQVTGALLVRSVLLQAALDPVSIARHDRGVWALAAVGDGCALTTA